MYCYKVVPDKMKISWTVWRSLQRSKSESHCNSCTQKTLFYIQQGWHFKQQQQLQKHKGKVFSMLYTKYFYSSRVIFAKIQQSILIFHHLQIQHSLITILCFNCQHKHEIIIILVHAYAGLLRHFYHLQRPILHKDPLYPPDIRKLVTKETINEKLALLIIIFRF
jgi:hypothetical protein